VIYSALPWFRIMTTTVPGATLVGLKNSCLFIFWNDFKFNSKIYVEFIRDLLYNKNLKSRRGRRRRKKNEREGNRHAYYRNYYLCS